MEDINKCCHSLCHMHCWLSRTRYRTQISLLDLEKVIFTPFGKKKVTQFSGLPPISVSYLKSVNESNIESNEEENWNLSGVDQSATINMKKFHKSMEMSIIQCAVCKEAWPLKNETLKTKRETDYTCGRCKRDKIFPKKFSHQNNMVPSPVPSELQGLTQFEEMLIARAFPVIHVCTEPRGGQRAYEGHVITHPQDVQQLADILPRLPKDLPVIIFTVNDKNNESKDFQVRRNKVEAALHWLVKNNPVYKKRKNWTRKN